MKLTSGTQLAERYEIVKEIGVGSVGRVFHVLDGELEGQSLAVKVLHSHLAADPQVVKRFVAEALIARQLTHPNIVRVYDVVATPELQFLTMEYVEGCSLDDLLLGCPGRRLPVDETLQIVLQILAALGVAHGQQVIHRDLKPSNILLDRNGAVKLADFGLAKAIDSSDGLTITGEIVGTPRYMAPEQFSGAAESRSDLYSVATILYELLSGAPPFVSDEPIALMQEHRAVEPSREPLERAAVPPWLVDLILRGLAKRCADRISTAGVFAKEIAREYDVSRTETARSAITTVVRQRRRSHHLLSKVSRRWVSAACASILLASVAAVLAEPPARARLAIRAVAIEKATGWRAAPVLAALGFGRFVSLDRDALFDAITVCQPEALEVVLSGYADPNAIDAEGVPALHRALDCTSGVLARLLAQGADPESRSPNGETPLLAAGRRGLIALIGELVGANARIDARDSDGNTLLQILITHGSATMLTDVHSAWPAALMRTQQLRNNEGLAAVHLAVKRVDLGIIERLAAYGYDLAIRDANGMTGPMHVAHMPLSPAAIGVMQVLTRSESDFRSARDNQGRNLDDHIAASGILNWREVLAEMRQ